MKYISKISVAILFLGFISLGYAAANISESSFLTLSEAPNSLALLPPPPLFNSLAFKIDQKAYKDGLKLKNTARWQQAIADANWSEDNIGKPFSKALGVEISKDNTPITYDVLRKIREDAGDFATKSAKEHYMRIRPFMYYHTSSCYPKDDGFLRKNGSYPSGHSAIGWTAVLTLIEIRPERQNELLQRGYDFGQSRVICGAHWQSDVDAARIMGAADFARLNADPDFVVEVVAAKKEIATKLKVAQHSGN